MKSDSELFETIRSRLFTAVLGDVMDAQGLTRQFLPPAIRALSPSMVLVGRAMPVLEADYDGDAAQLASSKPFGLMFRALDDLKPSEVYVCTGASPEYALWGELMSTRARALGAAGAVVDGFHRDTRGVLSTGLPVFSHGSYAQDQRLRGHVTDFRCAIEFSNGARVRPGDVLVGDIDGVLTIPGDQVEEVVHLALEKLRGEENVRELIERGQSTEEIFESTGIM